MSSISKAVLVFFLVLFLVSACAMAGLGSITRYETQHTLHLQAQAALAQANALHAAETTQTVLIVVVLVLVVFLALTWGGVMYVALRRPKQSRKWAPGPNAHWKRLDDAPAQAALDPNALLTLAVAQRLLGDPPQPQLPRPRQAAPAEAGDEDTDFWDWWWQQAGD